jgi:hypothetical protein
VASRWQSPIPVACASGGARHGYLPCCAADCRCPAAGIHAFPGADLAGQDGENYRRELNRRELA